MKRMKKLASLLLAMVMVLSMTVAAFADETVVNRPTDVDKGSFRINLNSKTFGYQYSAYQIFKGDLLEKNVNASTDEAQDRVLSNVEWGESVILDDSLITALSGIMSLDLGDIKKDDELTADKKAEKYSKVAKKVAEILGSETNREKDSDLARKFAKVMADGHIKNEPIKNSDTVAAFDDEGKVVEIDNEGKPTVPNKTVDKYVYTISDLKPGYYLVQDADGSVGNGEAYTRYIMEVVANVTANVKADAPTIDKKITQGTSTTSGSIASDGKTSNAEIGDVVNYEVTSAMPARDGYKTYFFVVKDTLSKGLDFNNDVAVTISGSTLAKDTDYTVSSSTDATTQSTVIEIVFKDFIKRQEATGSPIIIKYSATINENAAVGVAGNPNTVKLVYSNNPNVEPDADPDNPNKPNPNKPVGETPDSTTYTYVTGIELFKVDGATKKALSGAQFTIEGTKVDHKVIVYDAIYTPANNGDYYALTDGSYTKTAPDDDNKDSYVVGENQEYKRYTKTTNQQDIKTVTSTVKASGTVGANGVLQFEGLAEGTYEITEIKAPDGYNLLDAPIEVKIEWGKPDTISETSHDCTWKAEGHSVVNGIVQVVVENKSGALLPSTGGIGRTIFYAAGIILMAGAMFFVVRRKRA